MTDLTTWRELLTYAMALRNETLNDVVHATWGWTGYWFDFGEGGPPESKTFDDFLDREFDAGYGGTEGLGFTIWMQRYVYFPVGYDGAESAESVPRNPCEEVTAHVGGG